MALINYFRTDGWVKSVQGYAVPGAQIYVCSQPANVNALPPSPLVNIFSDVNGLVPITQPILTDGFGHYDFYAQAGVYTIVVGLNGIISQVYPDQSTGGASGTNGSGGGTALQLQVNGTLNVNQLLLNLRGQNSVAVSDAGNGTINITGPTFQTGGVTNTLQSVLNVKPGTGIGLASDALGGLTITNTAPANVTVPAGENVIQLPGTFSPFSVLTQVNSSGSTNTFIQYVPGVSLLVYPTNWKVTINTFSASTTVTMQIAKCTAGTGTVLSTANITFGGLTSPTLAPAGAYTSDTITFALSGGFDYFLLLNSSTGFMNLAAPISSGFGSTYAGNSNMIGQSTITIAGSQEAAKLLVSSFQSA